MFSGLPALLLEGGLCRLLPFPTSELFFFTLLLNAAKKKR